MELIVLNVLQIVITHLILSHVKLVKEDKFTTQALRNVNVLIISSGMKLDALNVIILDISIMISNSASHVLLTSYTILLWKFVHHVLLKNLNSMEIDAWLVCNLNSGMKQQETVTHVQKKWSTMDQIVFVQNKTLSSMESNVLNVSTPNISIFKLSNVQTAPRTRFMIWWKNLVWHVLLKDQFSMVKNVLYAPITLIGTSVLWNVNLVQVEDPTMQLQSSANVQQIDTGLANHALSVIFQNISTLDWSNVFHALKIKFTIFSKEYVFLAHHQIHFSMELNVLHVLHQLISLVNHNNVRLVLVIELTMWIPNNVNALRTHSSQVSTAFNVSTQDISIMIKNYVFHVQRTKSMIWRTENVSHVLVKDPFSMETHVLHVPPISCLIKMPINAEIVLMEK